MGNRNRNKNSPVSTTQVSNSGPHSLQVVLAIIAAVAAITVALIGYFGNLKSATLPIEATQTAEALHTLVAMTATAVVIQTQIEADNISATAFSGNQTALAIETEKENLSVSASQTTEALVVAQAFMTQTAVAQAMPTPTEIKPIRYDHIVEVGETLTKISKKYFILDDYADAIGRANCNPSPKTGDLLIIKYFYVQVGDTIDSIAGKFGGSPKFLRAINNLSQEVVFPPAGQILILPGKCSGH
jgi:LysM repeat protein